LITVEKNPSQEKENAKFQRKVDRTKETAVKGLNERSTGTRKGKDSQKRGLRAEVLTIAKGISYQKKTKSTIVNREEQKKGIDPESAVVKRSPNFEKKKRGEVKKEDEKKGDFEKREDEDSMQKLEG